MVKKLKPITKQKLKTNKPEGSTHSSDDYVDVYGYVEDGRTYKAYDF